MRRLLLSLGLLLAFFVVAGAGFAGFVAIRGRPTYPIPAVGAVRASTPARVAQGEKLAAVLCVYCHRDPATATLSGRMMPDLGSDLGQLYSANITQDPTHGLGRWTDAQLVATLRTGIGADGRLKLAMPHFAQLSDEDAASLVAFLRSDNALVRATPTPARPQQVSFLAKALTNTVLTPTPLQPHPADAPPASNPVALGRYLVVGRYQCYACHSHDFSTNDEATPEKSQGYLAGGNKMLDDKLQVRVTRNLTMEPETGLGDWSEEQFGKAVRYGMSPHGPLYAPMAKFSTMTDEEVHAIWSYLQTVPKIRNATPEDGGAVADRPLLSR